MDENAVFDEAPLFEPHQHNLHHHHHHNQHNSNSNDDLVDDSHSRPESSSTAPVVGGNKKLKIVLSSLAQNNLSNKNIVVSNSTNVNSDQNENSNVDSINKLVDSNSNDLQRDGEDRCGEIKQDNDAELPFVVKSCLQGFKFTKNTQPVKRGIENSGLCSIM